MFVSNVLSPLLSPLKLGPELLERVFFVCDYNNLQSVVDWPTFIHACYVMMYGAREEKFKCKCDETAAAQFGC